jgi:signal peptidase II
MSAWPRVLVVVGLAVATIGCDHATKRWAVRELSGGPRRSFLGDTFRLEYAENSGAFMSLGANLPSRARTPLIAVATGALLVGLGVVLGRRLFVGGSSAIGLGLAWAGGVSNLVDRLTTGQVVDFLNVGVASLRSGIFNVADLAILVGAALALRNARAETSPPRSPPR